MMISLSKNPTFQKSQNSKIAKSPFLHFKFKSQPTILNLKIETDSYKYFKTLMKKNPPTMNTLNPRLGEVFFCNNTTQGYFSCIEDLKGKYIINFGGGYKQAFTIEDKNLLDTKEQVLLSERLQGSKELPSNEQQEDNDANGQHAKSLVNGFHSEEDRQEFYRMNFQRFLREEDQDESLGDIAQQITRLSEQDDIYQICTSKTFVYVLTKHGKVYTFGSGEFGSLGRGGQFFIPSP